MGNYLIMGGLVKLFGICCNANQTTPFFDKQSNNSSQIRLRLRSPPECHFLTWTSCTKSVDNKLFFDSIIWCFGKNGRNDCPILPLIGNKLPDRNSCNNNKSLLFNRLLFVKALISFGYDSQ